MHFRNQALINAFIHGNDGSKYLAQVSTSSYAERAMISEETRTSFLAQFQEALVDPTANLKADIRVNDNFGQTYAQISVDPKHKIEQRQLDIERKRSHCTIAQNLISPHLIY